MTIHRLDTLSTVKLATGQVIQGITSAAKELVENSLDAGAKMIDIRFVNCGIDNISVSDDGLGLNRSDLEVLGQQHFTSKIVQYDDLKNLSTFGFRGSALHALAELSREISVCSKAPGLPNEEQGWKLTIKSGERTLEPITRKQGTTVNVEDLFSAIPVRRKILIKNAKRQMNEFLTIAQAYAIENFGKFSNESSVSINALRTQRNKRGVVSLLNSTVTDQGQSHDLLSAVYTVLLLRQISKVDILHFKDNNSEGIEIEGILSLTNVPNLKLPKSKFLTINGRLVTCDRLMKIVNKVYKMEYAIATPNSQLIFIRLKMPQCHLDVNLDPDKQSVLIKNEANILSMVEEALRKSLRMRLSKVVLTPSLDVSTYTQSNISGLGERAGEKCQQSIAPREGRNFLSRSRTSEQSICSNNFRNSFSGENNQIFSRQSNSKNMEQSPISSPSKMPAHLTRFSDFQDLMEPTASMSSATQESMNSSDLNDYL